MRSMNRRRFRGINRRDSNMSYLENADSEIGRFKYFGGSSLKLIQRCGACLCLRSFRPRNLRWRDVGAGD
jgi:hypothetical protein